nr:transposase [Mycobacterium avium]
MSTVAGDLELRIPKLRTGSFFPRCWSASPGSISACSRW